MTITNLKKAILVVAKFGQNPASSLGMSFEATEEGRQHTTTHDPQQTSKDHKSSH